ncbi:MAG: Cellulose-binding protein [Actinomycetota bacterium]|nr:Cellulose-binding protein [Actinomycetota bacterium]
MIISSGRSKVRSTVVVLAATALAVAGSVTDIAAPTRAEASIDGLMAAAAAGVEDEGADCPVNVPGSSASNSKLPDPFKKIDGARISAKADWRCRRQEIKKLAEKTVYGEKPGKPQSVTGTVSRSSISVNVTDKGKSSSFSAKVELPSGNGPFPAVVVLGGFGADTATIKAAGAAVINYDPLAVGKEGTPRNNKQGAFYSIYGAGSTTGILMAWAWGVSRIIDVIEQSDGSVLKADGMGVTGCSRYGKGAFVIGVFDQRIALTMPIESGTGGVPAFRSIASESGSQPLSSGYSEQPWFGDAFGSYTGNPNGLPVDTHEMVGMIAPRGLFIMENPHIAWLGARSGSVGALGGAEIYKALGAGENITYWSDVTDGNHCASRSEWKAPLQSNIKKFLAKTGTNTGVMRISSKASGNLSQWRDWQTPTLK